MTEQPVETPAVPSSPWVPEEPDYLILHSMMDVDMSNFLSSMIDLSSLIPPSSPIPLSPLSPDGTNEPINEPQLSFKSTSTYVAVRVHASRWTLTDLH